jgi:hypothetical protein
MKRKFSGQDMRKFFADLINAEKKIPAKHAPISPQFVYQTGNSYTEKSEARPADERSCQ